MAMATPRQDLATPPLNLTPFIGNPLKPGALASLKPKSYVGLAGYLLSTTTAAFPKQVVGLYWLGD